MLCIDIKSEIFATVIMHTHPQLNETLHLKFLAPGLFSSKLIDHFVNGNFLASSASIEIIAVRKRHDIARQMKWQAPFLL
jgi:hypothetical protein